MQLAQTRCGAVRSTFVEILRLLLPVSEELYSFLHSHVNEIFAASLVTPGYIAVPLDSLHF